MSKTANVLLCRAAPALRSSLFSPARAPCLRRGFAQETSFQKPLKLKGVLKPLKQFKVTPTVGTEFPEANLVDLINAPNADDFLRDLAITGKHADVCFPPPPANTELTSVLLQCRDVESSSFAARLK